MVYKDLVFSGLGAVACAELIHLLQSMSEKIRHQDAAVDEVLYIPPESMWPHTKPILLQHIIRLSDTSVTGPRGDGSFLYFLGFQKCFRKAEHMQKQSHTRPLVFLNLDRTAERSPSTAYVTSVRMSDAAPRFQRWVVRSFVSCAAWAFKYTYFDIDMKDVY